MPSIIFNRVRNFFLRHRAQKKLRTSHHFLLLQKWHTLRPVDNPSGSRRLNQPIIAGVFIHPWSPLRPHKNLGSERTSIRFVQKQRLGFVGFSGSSHPTPSRLASQAKKTIEGRCRRPFRLLVLPTHFLAHRHRPNFNQTRDPHRTVGDVSACGTPLLRVCAPPRESPQCGCASGACVHRSAEL